MNIVDDKKQTIDSEELKNFYTNGNTKLFKTLLISGVRLGLYKKNNTYILKTAKGYIVSFYYTIDKLFHYLRLLLLAGNFAAKADVNEKVRYMLRKNNILDIKDYDYTM